MDRPRMLGMVGLGRMGSGLSARATQAGIEVVAYDPAPDLQARARDVGAIPADDLRALVQAMPAPRAVWVMVPAGQTTQSVIDQLADEMAPGDTIIDGGNTFYGDDIHRAEDLSKRGLTYLDVGTSGGIWGTERGFCLMIGGPSDVVASLDFLWDALAPGVDAAPRTPHREGSLAPAEEGWLHCGPSGAGHFVKMVHNGIEYAVMAAYAEGLAVLKHADVGFEDGTSDAESAPLGDARYYRYRLPIADIAEVWRRGSVIGSWLLDLTADALAADPSLGSFTGRVSDSGEGRWTAIAAIDEGVPTPVMTAALMERFASQGSGLFVGQVLSAMRAQFGGHQEASG